MLRVGDELITLIDPDAPASEAYRTLRTNILMRNFDRDMKVINIISTTAQGRENDSCSQSCDGLRPITEESLSH